MIPKCKNFYQTLKNENKKSINQKKVNYSDLNFFGIYFEIEFLIE